MMVSGLVVSLDMDSPHGHSALTAIGTKPALTIGDRNGPWLSVALEASDPAQSERVHEWLRDLPGVGNVEVVFVHWDDAEETDADR